MVETFSLHHIKDVHKLLVEMIQQDLGALNETARKDYIQSWDQDKLTHWVHQKQQVSLVYHEQGQVLGALLGTPHESGVATVIWLVVDKSARGRSIGKQLMLRAAEEYRELGAHKIKLTVPDKNSKRFYEHIGLEEEAYLRKHWYQVDFWQMGWQL
ncbi:GNAT family N-acetyltransferase [Pleionea sp. CnH1-48]|uniref:GNAT family N-acetyltransferase n=1 Tax=Pleionea sp. CnH1-48 TaxID=2954494 RepID=UPI00209846A6|nr:GNAT family N-acetyltransferase [Pleionea sp. CnH1-48]MCO7226133.1 GNAT family N-acetyltransferase [Pleionea sp. CnH1-48]